MNNLEKLIRDHAYWSDKRKELRLQGSEELSKCTGTQTREDGMFARVGLNCIEEAFKEWKLTADDSEFGGLIPFDDFWVDHVADEQVCQHCQNVRELKKQRAYAGTRLGAVRAAMTRIGRRLQEESGDD